MLVCAACPTRARRPAPKQILLGAAEQSILQMLARYRYLTAQQVCRVGYAAGSLTYVQAKLKRLSDAGYLERLFLPRPSRTGSAPIVYCPARKGWVLLAQHGLDVPARLRPSEVRAHAYLFLAHTLAVNDVLIAAERLCRQQPQLRLAAVRHELALKRRPAQVALENGRRVGVIPDGWLDIRLRLDGHEYQCCVALEVDRGTTEQRAWRQKVRALLAWSRGPYGEIFGTTSLTIAVLATPGARRCRELLGWTEAELQRLGEQHQADLFRFSGASAIDVRPTELFLEPRWQRPFEADSLRLIDLARQR